MYNFALAFVICCIAYLVGEAVSNVTKAWVPSVFVTAVFMIVGGFTTVTITSVLIAGVFTGLL